MEEEKVNSESVESTEPIKVEPSVEIIQTDSDKTE